MPFNLYIYLGAFVTYCDPILVSFLFIYFWSCFSVGGIYTVIKSKAQVSTEELGEQYCLFGPYNESCVRTEVELLEPHHYVMKEVLQEFRDAGIKVGTSCVGRKPQLFVR